MDFQDIGCHLGHRQWPARRLLRARRRPSPSSPEPGTELDEARHRSAGPGHPRGHGDDRRGRVCGRAGRRSPMPTSPGRAGFRACYPLSRTADMRRRLHRERAERRAGLVPVEQLPDRQGDVRHRDHGAGGTSRQPAWASSSSQRRQRRRHRDLDLERGRPDLHLPDDSDERAASTTRRQRSRRSLTGRAFPQFKFVEATATPDRAGDLDQHGPRPNRGDARTSSRTASGRIPYDSNGVVADRVPGVCYALENATKSHFAGNCATGAPGVSQSTLLHEISHQWMGNAVTLENWNDIWFQEGWAQWASWSWNFRTAPRPTRRARSGTRTTRVLPIRSGTRSRPSSTTTRQTCSRRSRPTPAER